MTTAFRFRSEIPRLKAEVGKAMITSLSHAAGYIYKAARNSIKRRKSSSLPGEPPHTQTGVLKRGIAELPAFDELTRSGLPGYRG